MSLVLPFSSTTKVIPFWGLNLMHCAFIIRSIRSDSWEHRLFTAQIKLWKFAWFFVVVLSPASWNFISCMCKSVFSQRLSVHYFWFISLSHLFHCAWSPYKLLIEKARIHGVAHIQYFADRRDCPIWHNPEWKETNKLNSHILPSTPSCDVG